MDCIFCKIINGELPSYTIYEDDLVKVFLSIEPSSNGHMLIVPKSHYINLTDIDEEVLSHVNVVSKKMYKLLKEKLNVDGLTIMQNSDSAQEVMHYHMHLIPRFKDDSIELSYNKAILDKIEDVYNKITN